jgi:hypothetical protein
MPNRQQLLAYLARRPRGETETTLRVHGYRDELLDEAVRDGLAERELRLVPRGPKGFKVVWLTLTAAGQAALQEPSR